MSHFPNVEPIIGHWYYSKSLPESFTVIDQDDDAIEIQYHDGELDSLEHDAWKAANPQEIAEPEDEGPYDKDSEEDMVEILKEIDTQEDLEERLHDLEKDFE